MCTALFLISWEEFLHDYFSTIEWLTKSFVMVIVVRNSELPQGYVPYIPCIQGGDVANTPRGRSPRYTHPKSYRTPYLSAQKCFYPYCIHFRLKNRRVHNPFSRNRSEILISNKGFWLGGRRLWNLQRNLFTAQKTIPKYLKLN